MGKPLRWVLRKTLFGKKGNLIALDEPFDAIGKLMSGRRVGAFLDAGASDGRIARRLFKLFPDADAYLFEPHPNYTQRLADFAATNKKVHPQTVALSDETGEIVLHETTSLGQTSIFKASDRLAEITPHVRENHKAHHVPMVTLDNWSAEHGNPVFDVMKFDIQGAEAKALRGGRKTLDRGTKLVYTEVFFNRLYEGGAVFSEIDLVLRDAGFVLYNIFKPHCDARGTLTRADAIFVHAERMGM